MATIQPIRVTAPYLRLTTRLTNGLGTTVGSSLVLDGSLLYGSLVAVPPAVCSLPMTFNARAGEANTIVVALEANASVTSFQTQDITVIVEVIKR
jgi:hypothetical protein